jgi:hypothetical protein
MLASKEMASRSISGGASGASLIRRVRQRSAAASAALDAALFSRSSVDASEEMPQGRLGWVWIGLLVAAPMIVTAVGLLPEITLPTPNLNDGEFHFTLIQNMSAALAAGKNPIDFWMPQVELGFPAAFYYQHVPHLAVVLLDRLTFGAVDIYTLFNIVRWALLVTFPLTVYWSMRRMGFSPVASALAAAASPLLSGAFRFGFEFDSYIWRGFGMYTQLWAMHLSFISLACAYRTINLGRGYVWAILALSVLVLSHLLYAYMMAITLVLVVIVGARRATIVPRLARLAIIGGTMAAITVYQWLPWISTSQFLSTNPYLEPFKLDSFGAPAILGWLFTGELLDHGRLAVLTVLLLIGIVAALIYRSRLTMLALIGFLFWLVLYFGRPTLGPLYDILPLPNGLLLHRFIGGLEIFAIMLIGLGGALIWRLVHRIGATSQEWVRDKWRPAVAAGVVLLILTPALAERASFYAANTTFMTTANTAMSADSGLTAIIQTLRSVAPGRVYSGLREDWGKELALGDLHVRDVLVFNGIPVAGPEIGGLTLNSSLMWSFRDQDQSQYDLVDARYVITPDTLQVPAFYQLVQHAGRYALYHVSTSGAAEYVAIVARQRAATQLDLFYANRAWWEGTQPGARQFIRWDYIKPLGPQTTSPGCPDGGKTLFENDTSDSIHVVVDCPVAAALMFKVTYHPNWVVTVDHQQVETYMVSPSYVGIDLPAGTHDVEAVYTAAPIKIPLLAFGLMALLVVALLRDRLDWLPARMGTIRISRRVDASSRPETPHGD